MRSSRSGSACARPTPPTGPTCSSCSAIRSTPTRCRRRRGGTSSRAPRIATTRRSSDVADFEEYCHLYWEAWRTPLMRWLLSTVPTTMIFDDHDVHDDWNTSDVWVRQIRKQPWWRERIIGAYASYWIYQHIGNLSPADLREDEIYPQVAAAGDATEIAARLRRPRGARAERRPLELPARSGHHAPRRRGLARRSRPGPGAPRHARRGGVAVAGRPAHGRRRPPAHRDVAAVPARARHAPSRGVGRGGRRRGLGRAGGARRRVPAPGARPRALGGVRPLLPAPDRATHRGRLRPPRACAVLGRPALWRRAPRVCRGGDAARSRRAERGRPADVLAVPQPAVRQGAAGDADRAVGAGQGDHPAARPARRGEAAADRVGDQRRPVVRQPDRRAHDHGGAVWTSRSPSRRPATRPNRGSSRSSSGRWPARRSPRRGRGRSACRTAR